MNSQQRLRKSHVVKKCIAVFLKMRTDLFFSPILCDFSEDSFCFVEVS